MGCSTSKEDGLRTFHRASSHNSRGGRSTFSTRSNIVIDETSQEPPLLRSLRRSQQFHNETAENAENGDEDISNRNSQIDERAGQANHINQANQANQINPFHQDVPLDGVGNGNPNDGIVHRVTGPNGPNGLNRYNGNNAAAAANRNNHNMAGVELGATAMAAAAALAGAGVAGGGAGGAGGAGDAGGTNHRLYYEEFYWRLRSHSKCFPYGSGRISLLSHGSDLLLHDDCLLPHWKALAHTMKKKDRKDIRYILIKNVELKKPVLDLLQGGLEGKAIRRLELPKTNLGKEGLTFLSHFLEWNETVELIVLDHNPIHDVECALQLCDSLRKCPSLEELRVNYCQLGPHSATLLPKLLESVRDKPLGISLDGNQLRTSGAKSISHFLSCNPRITHMKLNENEFHDGDALLFQQALLANSNLQLLYLFQNQFTERGEGELLKTFYNEESLNGVVDSNHSCMLRWEKTYMLSVSNHNSTGNLAGLASATSSTGTTAPTAASTSSAATATAPTSTISTPSNPPSQLSQPGNPCMNNVNTPPWNKRRKLQYALRLLENGRLHNLNYLDDLPVEVMPWVLVLLQYLCDRDKVCALNKVYCVLRGWRMPVLYSFGGYKCCGGGGGSGKGKIVEGVETGSS